MPGKQGCSQEFVIRGKISVYIHQISKIQKNFCAIWISVLYFKSIGQQKKLKKYGRRRGDMHPWRPLATPLQVKIKLNIMLVTGGTVIRQRQMWMNGAHLTTASRRPFFDPSAGTVFYAVSQKKTFRVLWAVTLSNLNRFSNFFYCQTAY